MNNQNLPTPAADRLIIRGIHLELTDALRASIEEKSARLFRHQEHLVRIRIDLEHDKTASIDLRFVAKGRIELGGPDLIASVATDDAYKSVDLLIDKLDGQLRRRASEYKGRRHKDADVAKASDLPEAS